MTTKMQEAREKWFKNLDLANSTFYTMDTGLIEDMKNAFDDGWRAAKASAPHKPLKDQP